MENLERTAISIEKEDAGQRIDVFLAENLEEISRSSIKKLAGDGYLLVGGKAVKANYILRQGDFVEIFFPEAQPLEILPQDIPLDILYEDADVIVINKPQGMVVHPAPGHSQDTLVNALLFHCQGELSGINGMIRPGIVHRIDKDTSGVIVAAKNNKAHQSLASQLSEHTITRKYHAIVYNALANEAGTIDRPIARHPQDRKRMAIVEKNGRHAVTHYRVLQRLGNFNYIEAQLETGRTHQIRVHMASIGHPLLGDSVYGPKKPPFVLAGQVLHAKVLGFLHPTSGEYVEFTSPLPEYFEKLLTRLAGRLS